VYSMRWLSIARFFGVEAIHYRVRLKPESVKHNKVHCRIVGYRVWDTKKRRFDFVRWFGRVDPFHKKRVLKSILRNFPEVLSLAGFQWEVLVDLNYFLRMGPPLAGSIEIQNVVPAPHEPDKIFFYAKSSSILKPLMDFFGPEYLSVDEIEEHVDEMTLLMKDFH